jgi:hypothetical protein
VDLSANPEEVSDDIDLLGCKLEYYSLRVKLVLVSKIYCSSIIEIPQRGC